MYNSESLKRFLLLKLSPHCKFNEYLVHSEYFLTLAPQKYDTVFLNDSIVQKNLNGN